MKNTQNNKDGQAAEKGANQNPEKGNNKKIFNPNNPTANKGKMADINQNHVKPKSNSSNSKKPMTDVLELDETDEENTEQIKSDKKNYGGNTVKNSITNPKKGK